MADGSRNKALAAQKIATDIFGMARDLAHLVGNDPECVELAANIKVAAETIAARVWPMRDHAPTPAPTPVAKAKAPK